MKWLLVCVCAVLVSACPRSGNAVNSTLSGPEDAGVKKTPQEQALIDHTHTLVRELQSVHLSVDEALWASWLKGTPLDLAKLQSQHPKLFTKDSVELIRKMRELKLDDDRALAHVERHLVGEILNQSLSNDNVTLAGLEASVTMPVGDKELPWRDLNRLLALEKSAVKRKAIWTASLKVADRINAALARREEHAQQSLAALGIPSEQEWASETRELDREVLMKIASHFLDQTDGEWQSILTRLSTSEVNLPVEALTRADVPRLLRAPASVEAEFPKDTVAPRILKTLTALGLEATPGLTLDLADGATKRPLPLTVNPGGPGDVRVSVRPLAGLREQSLALGEVATGWSLHSATTRRFETDVLGDGAMTQATAELFESLPGEEGWLEDMGIAPEARAAIVTASRAQRLFSARQTCAVILIRLGGEGLSEHEIPLQAAAVMSHAFGVKHQPADGIRWRIDGDDVMRAGSRLRASMQGAVLREQLIAEFGPAWWRVPAAGKKLRALWAPGTSVPAEQQLGDLKLTWDALVRALSGAPVGGPVVAVPWPQPQTIAADAGVSDGGSPDASSAHP